MLQHEIVVRCMGVGTSRTLGVQGAGVLGVILPHMNEENIETESFCQCLSQLPMYIMDEVFLKIDRFS